MTPGDWIILGVSGLIVFYLVWVVLIGTVYSMIGGWRWDQYGLAALQVGAVFGVMILAIALIAGLWAGLYMLGQSLPI